MSRSQHLYLATQAEDTKVERESTFCLILFNWKFKYYRNSTNYNVYPWVAPVCIKFECFSNPGCSWDDIEITLHGMTFSKICLFKFILTRDQKSRSNWLTKRVLCSAPFTTNIVPLKYVWIKRSAIKKVHKPIFTILFTISGFKYE